MTPFLLMGAMSPVAIPAALVQQMAEALSGIALAQLIRPGCPVIFGSFLSNIDMQSGSPMFGTPESAIGLLCTGQIARHFGLPFRSGGGADVEPGARRAGGVRGADDDAADVPGGHELGDAHRRLARGRAGVVLREVHHRRRAAEDAAGGVHSAGDRRGVTRLRCPSGGRAWRSLPRRRAHDGAVPHLLLPAVRCRRRTTTRSGCVPAATTPPPARRGSTRPSSTSTSNRHSTSRSAPSSRTTSTGAASRARRLTGDRPRWVCGGCYVCGDRTSSTDACRRRQDHPAGPLDHEPSPLRS